MSDNTIQIILGILFVTLCFALGALLANKKSKKRKKARARRVDTLPLSAFSTLDHPAARHEIQPLAEAEVFMIYGKKAKAAEVLKTGVSRGHITPEEVDAFWAKHQTE